MRITWHWRVVGLVGLYLGILLWLWHPYMTNQLVGAGDMLWYVQVVGDVSAQTRDGVVEFWTGSSDWFFNGGVTPYRTAPFFPLLISVLDRATLFTLNPVALLNLTLVVCGVVTGLSSLAIGTVLSRTLSVRTVLVCVIFASAPWSLYLVGGLDLVLSSIAQLWLPWILGGLGLIASRLGDACSVRLGLLSLVFGTVGLVWTHPPIAVWSVTLVFPGTLWLLLKGGQWRSALLPGLFGAVGLLYPFLSWLDLRTCMASPPAVDRVGLVQQLSLYLPRALGLFQSASDGLHNFQLGPGVLFLLLMSLGWTLAHRYRARQAAPHLYILAVCIFALLPVGVFWSAVPSFWLSMANLWPMHRLVPVLAWATWSLSLIVSSGTGAESNRTRTTVTWVLVVVASVSLAQASLVRQHISKRTFSEFHTHRALAPENRAPMIHSYGPGSFLPSTYTHGVMDPMLEYRMVPASLGHDRLPLAAAPIPFQEAGFVLRPPGEGASPYSIGSVAVPSDRRIFLQVVSSSDESLTLQLVGKQLYREYALPLLNSTEAKGEGRISLISLWSTLPEGDEVDVRVVPYTKVGSQVLPRVECWAPPPRPTVEVKYKAGSVEVTVDSKTGQFLVTPRLYLPHYRIVRSSGERVSGVQLDGLLAWEIPAGKSVWTFFFEPPQTLRASFWCGVGAFVVFLALLPKCLRTVNRE